MYLNRLRYDLYNIRRTHLPCTFCECNVVMRLYDHHHFPVWHTFIVLERNPYPLANNFHLSHHKVCSRIWYSLAPSGRSNDLFHTWVMAITDIYLFHKDLLNISQVPDNDPKESTMKKIVSFEWSKAGRKLSARNIYIALSFRKMRKII